MKDKLFLLITILSIHACSCQVNTTDGQISQNIEESKKNGFFVKTYVLAKTSDPGIIVEEAWVEKIWFNTLDFGKTIKTPINSCQLCFNLKQTTGLKYKESNTADWLIKYVQNKNYPKTRTYVGMAYGVFQFSFPDCNVPDTLAFTLMKHTDSASVIKNTPVGTLIFRVVADSLKKK